MNGSLSREIKASLIRPSIFLLVGIGWLGIMSLVIIFAFKVSHNPPLSSIMSVSGDVATLIAFFMIYFKPGVFNVAIISEDKSTSRYIQSAKSFLYDFLSYILAWHAIAAIALRKDSVNKFVDNNSLYFLAVSVLFLLLAAFIIVRKIRRENI